MNIGITAQNSKKSLMEDFCIAYKGIFSKHDIYSTYSTGNRVKKMTNLKIYTFLPGDLGGNKQFIDMIERGDMDMVICFYDPNESSGYLQNVINILQACDRYKIPIATNIATAEMLVMGLDSGALDWRLNYHNHGEMI